MSGFGLMMNLSEQKGFREGSPGRQLFRRKGLSHSSFGGQNGGGGTSRIFHFKQGETNPEGMQPVQGHSAYPGLPRTPAS